MLQRVHLTFLVVVPVFYALLVKFSEPYDDARHAIDVGMIVLAAAWAGLVAVSTAMYGKGDTLRERLVSTYRQFLQKLSFMWFANLILAGVCSFLVYELVAFRQVEFYSDEDILLILNDKPGNVKELGILKAKTAQKFRLELGQRTFVFSDPMTKAPKYSSVVSVQPLWKMWELDRVIAPKSVKGSYEKTKS